METRPAANQWRSADLEFAGEIKGVPVKTVYTMLKERIFEKSLKEYADICELDPEVIVRTADDFTSYGRRAGADFYRGPVQHTNGTYTARTLGILNFLIGNVSWKGGCEAHGGSHWHEMGGKPGNPYQSRQGASPGQSKSPQGCPSTAKKPITKTAPNSRKTAIRPNGHGFLLPTTMCIRRCSPASGLSTRTRSRFF